MLMPFLYTSYFSEEEKKFILPLLNHKSIFFANKVFNISLESEYLYHFILESLYRDRRFITPVPLRDMFMNKFYSSRKEEYLKSLDIKFLNDLGNKILLHISKKTHS